MGAEQYFEETVRFNCNFEERVYRFYPNRVGIHSLAKALIGNLVEDRETCEEIFWDRVSHLVKQTYDMAHTGNAKPSRYEVQRNRESFRLYTRILHDNLDLILKRCLDDDNFSSRLDFSFEDSKNVRRLKALNDSIFIENVRKYLAHLSVALDPVCEDYSLVQCVLKDSSRFPELEELCKGPLEYFVRYKKVKGIDEDSQRQEGRLAIWGAAKNYEARGFARFPTMARKALHFKYCNLLRMFAAQKRKVQKFTYTMGSTTNEPSRLMNILDDMAFKEWSRENGRYNPEFFPFRSYDWEPDEVLVGVQDDYDSVEEVDSNNFPYMNEYELDILDVKGIRMREAYYEFRDKYWCGEFSEVNGEVVIDDQSKNLVRFHDVVRKHFFNINKGSYEDAYEEISF